MPLVAYHCPIVLFDRKFGDRPAPAISDLRIWIRTDAGFINRVFGDNSSSQSADSQKNPVSLGLMGRCHVSVIAMTRNSLRNDNEQLT
ncbi:hypothetical protein [Microcoleus sp. B4-D4]|uniref:hypothetical protein n=1 Tax=Microcoleus sp. B4-D4 TaxID=2818667 RepID=UPI002FD0C4C3